MTGFCLPGIALFAVFSVPGTTAHAQTQGFPGGVLGGLKPKPAITHPVLAAKARSSSTNTLTGDAAKAELEKRGLYDSLGAAIAAAELSATKIDPAGPYSRGAEYFASNPNQKLRAWFSKEGVELASGSKAGKGDTPWSVQLRLQGVGRAGDLVEADQRKVTANGAKVQINAPSGLVTEWYENRSDGIEQGFTVNKAPPGGLGPLRVILKVAGTVRAKSLNDAAGVEFVNSAGAPVVSYKAARAWDATGRPLRVRMEVSGESQLDLVANDSGARYPVTIDPLFASTAAKLVEPSGNNAQLGFSVSLSGSTALVGAYDQSTISATAVGSAYVFVNGGAQWTQQAELTASDGKTGDFFGFSVVLSADGNTALVGAPEHTTSQSVGSAYVFIRNGIQWTQQMELTVSYEPASDEFGGSVALDADGNTALIGANRIGALDAGAAGSAYVFVRNGIQWSQQEVLTPNDGAPGDDFGVCLALSADGNMAVVGGPYHATSAGPAAGSAYVFVRSGIQWSQQTELTASDGVAEDEFGNSVAMSADGDTALVGAPGRTTSAGQFAGSAYVFGKSGGLWSQQAELTASDGVADNTIGFSVALDADGNIALIGGPGYFRQSTAGSAYVFVRNGIQWSQQTELSASDGADGDGFGTSVALSADGNTAFVGAPGHTTSAVAGAGSAYLFVNSGDFWSQQAELTVSYGVAGDEFGNSVALSSDGNTALVGAPGSSTLTVQYAGSAYVFTNSGGLWSQQAELTASDGAYVDQFGSSVALNADGSAALVGAPNHTLTPTTNAGSAYVFVNNGMQWIQQAELTAADSTAYVGFGDSVALSADGSTALVGAPNQYEGIASPAGSAYVFVKSEIQWSQQAELTANDGTENNGFGDSVALSADGNTALVGAPGHATSTAQYAGSAYVFLNSGTQWSQEAKLTAGDGASGDIFGSSVALSASGSTALVGASQHTTSAGSDAGSAYVFVNSGTQWSQQAELTANSGAAGEFFASSVALSSDGSTALVGAPFQGTANLLDAGSAYVFERSGTVWDPGPELTAGVTAASYDFFGYAVALGGSTGLVGSRQGAYPGYAFVFAIGELPEITVQPQSQTVLPGNSVTFNVTASGYAPLSYQWRINGNPISGATGTSYTISSTGTADQGNYDVVVSNVGGSATSAEAELVVNSLTDLNLIAPGAQPDAEGILQVNLTPAGLSGVGWRFVGEQQWRPSGVQVANLTTDDYEIEFRPVPGYLQPSPQTVEIVSGSAPAVITAEYYSTPAPTNCGINVTIEPSSLTNPSISGTNIAQWRIIGDPVWQNSGATVTGLSANTYPIEFKPVPGETTPVPEAITVPGPNGPIVAVEGTYIESGIAVGTAPVPVDSSAIASGTGLPFGSVGQIRSDNGDGTGFVVLDNVVATAGHVVFDDNTMSYTTGMQWLFQREAGSYEPAPVIPAGVMVLSGYKAQRAEEGTPGVSTPQSYDLDVGAMYFLGDAGRGGSSGYLASDSTPNEFLTSSAMMMLVGYPVDGIPEANQGQMYATPPANIGFTLELTGTTDANTGLPYRLYTTTDITSVGGASGGPLCVQINGDTYYPAAIYLGGNGNTVVRAIDSNVVSLFNAAETSGGGGYNHGGGGIIDYVPESGGGAAEGGISVTLNLASGGWRLGTSDAFQQSGATLPSLTSGTYEVTFEPVLGYQTPSAEDIPVESGNIATFTVTYAPLPPSISSALVASGTEETAFGGYQVTAINYPAGFAATNLPPGLAMSDTTHGIISGTPLASGLFTSTIQAINASGTDTKTLTFNIAPEITSSEITSATAGQLFRYQITTGSNDVITSFGFSGILPNGVTANPAVGTLSGTPLAPGLFNLTMSAAGAGGVNTEPLTLLVDAPGVAGVVLSVSADGAGNVTNVIAGQTLQLPAQLVGTSGSSYEFQAVADAGSYFGGWTGGVVSDANPLGGTITGNLSIEAVFSTYASAKGSYAGLIGTTPATIGQAGSVQLTLNAKGGYTGKMLYGGVTYTLKGAFDQTGSSTPVVKHGAAVGPAVQLHLETVTGSPQVTGSVSGASSAALLAKKAGFTKAQPFDKAGRYTALIESGTNSGSPQGIGYGALTVSTLGNISFAGVLNDGTKVSVASTISADQTWPFYASPYKTGGFISGWVTFLEQTGTSDFNGTLDWGKAPTTNPKATYPSGFQTQTALIGSLYELKHGASILDFPDTTNNAILTFGFTPSLSGTITIGPRNTLVLPVPDKLSLKFNLTDGLFSGRVMEDGSLSSYGGAVFQTGTYGGGLILSGTASDPVMLGPNP